MCTRMSVRVGRIIHMPTEPTPAVLLDFEHRWPRRQAKKPAYAALRPDCEGIARGVSVAIPSRFLRALTPVYICVVDSEACSINS